MKRDDLKHTFDASNKNDAMSRAYDAIHHAFDVMQIAYVARVIDAMFDDYAHDDCALRDNVYCDCITQFVNDVIDNV